MNVREQGFLLLTSHLGDPQRRVLTGPQLRTLTVRAQLLHKPDTGREMMPEDLIAIGYSREAADRILALLSDTDQLLWYLDKGAKMDCFPISRAGEIYPQRLRLRLGTDCPGCLWGKGDPALLLQPAVALVGSREMNQQNLRFAQEVGRQAALQGYVLVSGNARGADRAAQDACLEQGGQVISVVSDSLAYCPVRRNMLYLSEDSFDATFSSQRALSRNRVIHCLADAVFVAQSAFEKGGTWNGTVKNLKGGWSPVLCFDDGSQSMQALAQMGASLISCGDLLQIKQWTGREDRLF